MPGPGRIINQGVLNSKTSRNCQELPRLRADTIQLGIYRTALREREDNILPYGGVRSFGWNHSTGYAKMYLSPPQKRTGWARALAE